MTDRERQMIEEYLPNPPDPTLGDGEYYYLQNERVIRVYPLDILPNKDGGTCYGIYTKRGGRLVRVDDGYGDPFHGVYFYDLYDNKEDCRNRTHWFCEEWERLRELQQKEAEHVDNV